MKSCFVPARFYAISICVVAMLVLDTALIAQRPPAFDKRSLTGRCT